ncbi:hypothetical protein TNCV_3627791 [Trichonephila clavipes]|nr:hypothetical protein TNCV_3627791 [Trichonephila clavipes]
MADLKVNFVSLPGATTLPRAPHKGVDQTTVVPVVGSFSVWKMWQAWDLPASYEPNINRTTILRMRNKTTQAVHTTTVFQLHMALNLKAKFWFLSKI